MIAAAGTGNLKCDFFDGIRLIFATIEAVRSRSNQGGHDASGRIDASL